MGRGSDLGDAKGFEARRHTLLVETRIRFRALRFGTIRTAPPVLFENLNHLGRCAFVESQRASEAGFAIDPLIV